MRNLPNPGIDALAYFDKISEEKRGVVSERLVRLRKRIGIAYAAYTANSHALENIVPAGIGGVRAKALVHAYSVPTKTMRAMRGKLLQPNIQDFDECPYCGISEPKTLDHYFPKETFPEFSIFPENLVPICHVCNTLYKGSQLLSATGDRLFLHTYCDEFPKFDFLTAQITVNEKIHLDFSNRNDPDNVGFSLIFANHFEKLGLNRRFINKSVAEISRKRTSLRRFYGVGNYKRVSRELRSEADDLRVTLSGNHWKVALYDGLAESESFCDGGFMKVVES